MNHPLPPSQPLSLPHLPPEAEHHSLSPSPLPARESGHPAEPEISAARTLYPSSYDGLSAEQALELDRAYADFEEIVLQVQQTSPDASDIQFVGGGHVWVHANGADRRTSRDVTNEEVLTWAKIFGQRGNGDDQLRGNTSGAVENAIDIVGVRLRMTFRRQLGGYGLNVRILAQDPPTLDSARFQANPVPPKLIDIVMNNSDGVVLFEGPTGSGKSTMQAALVAEINRHQHRHVYTVEDPIEFVHVSNKSLITQRQVGSDVDSFEQGLITAKRSKPGVILLGELRDRTVMRAAIQSAGEGHLVLATSHAADVASAIASFVGSFSSDEQAEIRQRLAAALRAVVVQKLVPAKNGKVIPARELLVVNSTLQAKLRETSSSEKITQALDSAASRDQSGSFSTDDDLIRLCLEDLITPEVALRYARKKLEVYDKFERARVPNLPPRPE